MITVDRLRPILRRTATFAALAALTALAACGVPGGAASGPDKAAASPTAAAAASASPAPASSAPASPAPASPAASQPPGGARLGATRPGTVPPVIFHGPRNRKRIALTFDSNMTDAMVRKIHSAHADYANEKVVAELQRLGVPATFFLAAKWIEAYPALTQQIAADPRFELASHSWAHAGFRPKCYGLATLTAPEMAPDVNRSFEVLDRYAPGATRYFRFPGGCYDQAALRAIAPSGCTVVQYDVPSGDAFGRSSQAIIDTTLSRVTSGSIVVLHITEANSPFTDEALPVIVAKLRARGYELVTLGNLLTR